MLPANPPETIKRNRVSPLALTFGVLGLSLVFLDLFMRPFPFADLLSICALLSCIIAIGLAALAWQREEDYQTCLVGAGLGAASLLLYFSVIFSLLLAAVVFMLIIWPMMTDNRA